MKKIVILISGRGSNMQALLDAGLPCQIAAVISNRADAQGLSTAAAHGIPTAVVEHKNYADRESFDAVLAREIEQYQPDVIVLAGFMRILTDAFVERFRGKLINIHPSLLPAYPGTRTHQRAIQDGVKIHGCTVHFVTPTLDAGPIIMQAAVPVLYDDTADSLAARVLQEEHRIYPQVVRHLCLQHIWLADSGRVQTCLAEHPAAALIAPHLN